MDQQPIHLAPVPFWVTHRLLIKAIIIAGIVLLLLIPGSLVQQLVEERSDRREQVVKEISSKWAGRQTVTGPMLLVPYNVHLTTADGKGSIMRKWMHVLPETLRINGQLDPELRSRGIYTAVLYRSGLQLDGRFAPLERGAAQVPPEDVLWQEARLILGIGDVGGLEDEIVVTWNGQPLPLEAGLPKEAIVASGLSAATPLAAGGTPTFALTIKLKGSEHLYFTPVGKTTSVALQSAWKHPAFDGHSLPTHTDIDAKGGFAASWKVMQASRNYGQSWTDGKPDLAATEFGARLVQPADGYARIERASKYSILFIALTFTIFFFLEIIQRKQVHPLQYTLVGLALCVFYTLLLSISEYSGFNTAYLIAATATVMLIGLYVWSVFHSGKTALGFGAALGALYSYIFIIIQMEDLSLIFGSVGLFVIIAILMYFSRKLDWYGNANSGRQHPVSAPAP